MRGGGPLPVPAVRWLAAGCAEALESIHNAGLVHRDLKPSNVLVSPDGPRVIDFGVARAAERIQLTVTRGALGTPAYMAPEQARDTRQASAASDVFSLGATLLFAATGHPPYQGDTVMDVLVRLATEPPDLGGLPPELTRRRHRLPGAQPAEPADFRGHPGGAGPLRGGTPQPGAGTPTCPLALALIGEYQRSPQPAGTGTGQITTGPLTDDVSEDATFGSYTALAAARWRRRPRQQRRGRAAHRRGAPAARPRGPRRRGGRRRGIALVAPRWGSGSRARCWGARSPAPGSTRGLRGSPPPRPAAASAQPGRRGRGPRRRRCPAGRARRPSS